MCVVQPAVRGQCLRQPPVAFTRDAQEDGFALTDPHFDQLSDSTPRLTPLFPVAHPQSPSDPTVELHRIIKLQSASIVSHPALNVLFQAKDSGFYGDSRTSTRNTLQFPFEALNLAIQRLQLLTVDLKSEH